MSEPHAELDPAGTRHPAVDAVIEQLDAVPSRPPQEQIAAYEQAHRELQETLRTVEER